MFKKVSQIPIDISVDNLVQILLKISETEKVCFLDSCRVGHLDSHLLIAGIKPLDTFEITNENADKTLARFNELLSDNLASIFTISYDFGLKLQNIKPRKKTISAFSEPDIFLATFDCLIIHDYKSGKTYLKGNPDKLGKTSKTVERTEYDASNFDSSVKDKSAIRSNFTRDQYISKIEEIQEYIRNGDTYQTNLTQQFRAKLAKDLTPQKVFWNLRKNHPAPFSSFIKRKNDCVVSISPERFVRVENKKNKTRQINTSPIKGTRRRGTTEQEDQKLKNELLESKKDRAENIMIVDLLRNDIGKICEFGSVKVEKLCDLEEHPSLFHLVSTVSGSLRSKVNFADIIKAIFPCGSITGCPKIRTMEIIDELETRTRGLSMGAIGYCDFDNTLDLSVAIRTVVIRNQEALFNVGGGIVIDSNPRDEYKESLLKAKAIFEAIVVEKF